MAEYANGRLHVELECKECELSNEVRSVIREDLEQIGYLTDELGKCQLWLTVVFHPRSKTYHARAKLKAPGETIITGDQRPEQTGAIHLCLEKVRRRVEAYRASPNEQAVRRAETQTALADDIVATTDVDAGALGEAAAEEDYQAFRRAMFGLEGWLRNRVGRWIQRYPEVQREVGQTFEISDLVEEVFLLAFEKYSQRPDEIRMHDWLDRLIDPAVRDFWFNEDDQTAASFAQTLAGEPRT